ncbi:MAG: CDP-alcohol phosphatidyltransferase family protein [Thaumarchaeota archaeon]|nr:CDP-alcohol phosphatidyltransferase family protein [Nitrososphaerota archaeon]
MVLNRIRNQVGPIVDSIGKTLGGTGLSPNFWTYFGFVFALLAGILYAWIPAKPYLAATAILVSGIFDIVDGAVARVTNKISKSGAFTDSTLDRLAEVAIYAGIIYASYTNPILVLLALSFSLLVSYERAKGDSLGVSLSGIGIGERAERLIVLIVFSFIGIIWVGVLIVFVIAFITFLQRYYAIMRKLKNL